MSKFQHQPVMVQEVLEALRPRDGGLYIDCTLGGGGHSRAILEASAPTGRLIALDRDAEAIQAGSEYLQEFASRTTFIQAPFSKLGQLEINPQSADGILMDIGVSSYQLDELARGFSYMQDGPLDMRMDQSQHMTAQLIVNTYTEEEMRDIFYRYGEEKWAKRIAEFIMESRRQLPIVSTGQLVEIIKKAVPKGARDKDQHPAKRVFQALRIEVNQELKELEEGLEAAKDLLKPGGRLAVITFHSLEDRIVKEKFKYFAAACLCPPAQPICNCHKQAEVKIITKRPLLPGGKEIQENPRARSAKMRILERL